MKTWRDDAGGSLQGDIDGVNTLYTTSQAMRLDRVVDVFVNGFCRMAELDNGYDLISPRTLALKEALLPGDTLSIRYNAVPCEVGVANSQPQGLVVDDIDLLGHLFVAAEEAPCPVEIAEVPERVQIALRCPGG